MKSNMTKHFQAKAKRGLCMAQGGLLDPQAQQTTQPVAPYTDFVERENAEKTARWRQDDQLSRGIAPQAVAGLGAALQPQQPQQPAAAAAAAAAPMYTDSLERENAEKTARWRQDSLLTGRGLRMAEGGMVPETAEQVMARMANKYGTTGAAQAAPVAQPAPAPVAQQAPAPQPKPTGGLFGRALGGLRQANEQLRQVSNYAEGGIVRGKGGPTDDEVPMTIGGTDVNLSNKEAVLPAKTVDALGGPEAVEALIEETNGKPPVSKGLRQGGEYSEGVTSSPQEAWAEHQSRQAAAAAQKQAAVQTAARAEATGAALAGDVANTEASAATLRPTPPAPKPLGFGGRAMGAVRSFATNPAMMVPTGVMVAKGAADLVDSIPSLRGRATAEASNMELAGTPQHDAEVNSALVAKDAAWEQRHGKTLSDAQRTNAPQPAAKPKLRFEDLPQASYSNEGRSVPTAGSNPVSTVDRTLVDNTLGKDATLPQGLRGRWAGNDPMKAQQFTSADNAANGLRNNPANGHGVVSIKQKDGSFKNVLMGPSDYTAADGSKTSDWSKTSQFAQGTAQAAKDKVSLRDMQYQNAKFNATSDQITDPNARAAGMRGLAQYDVEEKQKAETAKNAASAESARIGHLLTERGQNITLAGHKAMQGNTDRAFKAEQDGKVAKRIKDSLDIAAPTEGLKDEALAVAKQNRADLEQALYAAHKTMPTSEAEYAQESPNMLNQSKLSVAMRNAVKNAGMLNRIGNVGHDMWTSLNALTPVKQGDNLVFEGGFTIPYKNVIGNDADLDAAYKARIAKVK